MELEFKTTSISYLKCVLQDIRCQEETGEMIVPDSEPDIESIIASFADVVFRSKECRNGCVVISGGIKGYLLYRPEDHSVPKGLQFYLPFTVRFENTAITEHAKVLCKVNIRSSDGRMLNSRKAMMRASICCSVLILEEHEEILYLPMNLPNSMQVLENTYTLCQPVETSEKSFVISEQLEFPQHKPPVVKIIRENCRLEMLESKLVGDKGVFKGQAVYKFLYLSEDNSLYTYEQVIPFSQYCEFGNDYDEQSMDVLPVVSGYDLQIDSQMPSQFAQLSISVLVQCIVSDHKNIQLIEDAFCLGKEFLPQWQTYQMQCQLDSQLYRNRMRCQFHECIAQIIDCDVYVDIPTTEQIKDDVCITLPLIVQILALDERGEIICLQEHMKDKQNLALASNVISTVRTDVIGELSASVLSGGAEVHFEVMNRSYFHTQQAIKALCGAELREVDANAERKPAVIIKKVTEGTLLWDIAKENHARVQSICEANKLQASSAIKENRVLLIPVG